MDRKRVNGSGKGPRSGAQTLLLLAAPLNVSILRVLADGPVPQIEVRQAAGLPAHTTLRAHLRQLAEVGAIAKHRHDRFPGALELELTAAGHDLRAVMTALADWLADAPAGPAHPGDETAKAAIKALAEGWSSTILRALAAKPLTLTELDRIIGALNYPALERRLAAMRLAGQIEARPGNGRGTPYTVTEWLRRAAGPLCAAIHWERRHLAPSTPPPTRLDAEAIFLLAVPLLRLPDSISGSCRLVVEIANGHKPGLAGIAIDIERGSVASYTTRLREQADAWASGSFPAWLAALIDDERDGLEAGGEAAGLARAVLDGLPGALLGGPQGLRGADRRL